MKNYLFAFLILCAASANAGLNKWVDEHGKVHYSDQPPAGIEASTVRNAPPPAIAPPAAKSFAEKEYELKKKQQSGNGALSRTAQEQANREIEKFNQEIDKANCEAARMALRAIQQGGRIVEFDDKGERRFLEDNERQQRAEKTQAEVDKWCK